ncbi:MAG: hypothetical protein Q9227_006434 [Pyrenula ochraceoflavens]
MIKGLQRDGFNFPQLESWKSQLRGTNKHQRRCARSTKGPKARAILSNEFKRRYEVLDLDRSKDVRVFVLRDTATSWLFEKCSSDPLARSSRRITDFFERFLIALFGSSSILNTQAGDYRLSFTPSTRDTTMLSTIGTAVMHSVSQSVSKSMDPQIKLRLSAITETIRDRIPEKLPKGEMTKGYVQYVRNYYVKQAASKAFHGHCIAAIIGEAVTEQSVQENTGAFLTEAQQHVTRSSGILKNALLAN